MTPSVLLRYPLIILRRSKEFCNVAVLLPLCDQRTQAVFIFFGKRPNAVRLYPARR